MSAPAPRNRYPIADEQQWQESSDIVDLSPPSVWAPDAEEEDETTLQGKRVAAQYIEKEGLVATPRRIRILDESQVLPGEASYATVSLNQPFEESVLKPQTSWEPTSTSVVDDYLERTSSSRVRLLDESQILAGEASFATVMLGRGKAQRHSAISEFLVKTKLSAKQLVLAMLALFSVVALAVVVVLRMTSSGVVIVNTAPPPTTVDTASQSMSTATTDAPESVLIWNTQGNVSGSAGPTEPVPTVAETPGVTEAKLTERVSSDDSRNAPSSDAKSGAVPQETLREVTAVAVDAYSRVIETKKQPASVGRKAVKEQAVVKTPNASVSSEPRETRPEPPTRQSAAPVKVENVETKTPPITGGGERPRTVTRKSSP